MQESGGCSMWLDRIKDVILSDETEVRTPHKECHDPIYNNDLMEFYKPPHKHKWSLSGPKNKHTKSQIRMNNTVRKLYDHYCGGGEPHCIVCGETDRRVLCLHHVHGRKRYPVEWVDIVHEGFPEGWIMPLCANHHRIEHSTVVLNR
jgi:hypothetical protein